MYRMGPGEAAERKSFDLKFRLISLLPEQFSKADTFLRAKDTILKAKRRTRNTQKTKVLGTESRTHLRFYTGGG